MNLSRRTFLAGAAIGVLAPNLLPDPRRQTFTIAPGDELTITLPPPNVGTTIYITNNSGHVATIYPGDSGYIVMAPGMWGEITMKGANAKPITWPGQGDRYSRKRGA